MQIDRRRRQLAKGSAAPLHPDDVAKLLAAESRQVDRLARLIEEMLDVSRINSRRFVIERQPVELGDLAREVSLHHAAEAARLGCEITVEAPAPVRGVWDPCRLEQVVSNLLTNAMKYGPGRPVRVSVTEAPGRAVLQVRDEGRGIAPADQARIFRRFERAVSANEVSGLGIGLFIVQQIVELHGGSVRVDSALGAGSTFTVELPTG